MTHHQLARTTTRRTPTIPVASLLVVIAAIAVALGVGWPASSSSTAASPSDVSREDLRGAPGAATSSTVWPAYGQAAFIRTGQSEIQASPNQHAAPIASVAKVMTAYLVLRDHPLRLGQDGPTITLTDADAADTNRRRGHEESVVPIAAGEQLTERQALQALLLPSANNIAAVLARWDAGSVDRFVGRMNATARALGMTHTRYTDPSGYDDATVSTAADQVRVVIRAMRLPVFASIVATPRAILPVAGIVHNTNTLLGHNGFVGVKTGSLDAAGGCFAFGAVRWIGGKRTTITGVVLGQPGHDQIAAALAAADAMVARITGHTQHQVRALPGLPQPPLAPGTAARSHRPRLPARRRTRVNVISTPREKA
jgi:D-alanyl-D-alanine carboxypeptidase (penicillin-binding protein 5/6)